jgi:hypothetical protein
MLLRASRAQRGPLSQLPRRLTTSSEQFQGSSEQLDEPYRQLLDDLNYSIEIFEKQSITLDPPHVRVNTISMIKF